MLNNFWEFINSVSSFIGVRDVFDILIVAVSIYLVLVFIRQTRLYFILNSVLFFLGLWFLSNFFNFSLTRQILQYFFTSIILIFAVVFQKEIKRFFEWFLVAGRNLGDKKLMVSSKVTEIIMTAVENLAKKKVGALIVLPGRFRLDNFLEGGLTLSGQISVPLILSIFDSSSPGHDGAMIIEGDIIKRFGVHLPLAENYKRYGNIGTRHRAALGLAEKTDAYTIVVSEERGTITLAHDNTLQEMKNINELTEIVSRLTKEKMPDRPRPWRFFFLKNFWEKIISLSLAILFWLIFTFQAGTINKDFIVPIGFRFLPNNMIVEGVNPNKISVTLSGDYRDFNNVKNEDVKIYFDESSFQDGWQRVKIIPEMLSLPPYLTVVNISPKFFEYKLKTK
jgi:diadenylate cyclase